MAVTAAVVARLGHVEDTLGLLEVGGKKATLLRRPGPWSPP
ncbi:hypothetical protein ACQ4WX_48445 [Streptomyces lasalocidi]